MVNLHLETQFTINLQSNCLSLVELSSSQLAVLFVLFDLFVLSVLVKCRVYVARSLISESLRTEYAPHI